MSFRIPDGGTTDSTLSDKVAGTAKEEDEENLCRRVHRYLHLPMKLPSKKFVWRKTLGILVIQKKSLWRIRPIVVGETAPNS